MAEHKVKSASRSAVWAVLILIVLGLGGFGAVGFSGSVRSLGKVGDTEIPVSRYARQLDADLRMMQSRAGAGFGMAEAQQFGLDRAALGKVVAEVAKEHEAGELGLSAGDAQVHQALMQIRDFQGFDGAFDRTAYQVVL